LGGVFVEGECRLGVEVVGEVGVGLIYLVKGGKVWVRGCLEGVGC
jgi:hypothetical protein